MVLLILCGRKRLFSLINDLPTVFEVVTDRKPIKDKPTVDSGSKSRGSTKVSIFFSSDNCFFVSLFLLALSPEVRSKAWFDNACAFQKLLLIYFLMKGLV